MKVKVISLPYVFQVLYVLCFTRPRYKVSVYRTIGPLVLFLACNEDMDESLDEFKFRPDTTTISRVICPCASEKLMYNIVNTLAPLFLIGSSSYWQVSKDIYNISDEFEIRPDRTNLLPRTAELAALERLEKSP